MKRSLLLVALLSIGCSAAHAQSSRSIHANDRSIAEALVGLGVSPDSPAIRAAVPRAFAEIYPRERYERYRLSVFQARAIAYTALLLASDFAPAAYPAPDGPWCPDLTTAAYDLSGEITSAGSLFLSTQEKALLHRDATEIRRLATACGCLAVAEAALDLSSHAGESMPSRSTVVEKITDLRRLASLCE